MKKTAIGLCLLLVLTGLALPQNKKGTWFLGASFGGAGYSFGHSESSSSYDTYLSMNDSSYYNFSIFPQIGYYLQDNFVLGGYFSLGFYGGKSDSSSTYSTTTAVHKYRELYVSVGPFVRYYLGQEGGKGRPYVHAYVQANLYPFYTGEYVPSTGTGYTYEYTTYKTISAGLQIGYEHYLNPTLGLQYYVGYSFSSNSYKYQYDYPTGIDPFYHNKSYTHGFSFGVGLQIHLSRDKK